MEMAYRIYSVVSCSQYLKGMTIFDSQPSHEVGNFIIPILQVEKRRVRFLPERRFISHYLFQRAFCSGALLLRILFQKITFFSVPFPTKVFNPSKSNRCFSSKEACPQAHSPQWPCLSLGSCSFFFPWVLAASPAWPNALEAVSVVEGGRSA